MSLVAYIHKLPLCTIPMLVDAFINFKCIVHSTSPLNVLSVCKKPFLLWDKSELTYVLLLGVITALLL